MKPWKMKPDFEGCFLEVPTFTVQCDLSVAALEWAIKILREGFGELPQTLLYAEQDTRIANELRFGPSNFQTRIPYWIPVPTENTRFTLLGRNGIVMSEGA